MPLHVAVTSGILMAALILGWLRFTVYLWQKGWQKGAFVLGLPVALYALSLIFMWLDT